MKTINLMVGLAVLGLSACGESKPKEPPPIENLKEMGISELQTYQDTHCQTDFIAHPRCIAVNSEYVTKSNLKMLGQDVKP